MRARVLTAIFLVNLAVLGTLSVLLWLENRRNVRDWSTQIESVTTSIVRDMLDTFTQTGAQRRREGSVEQQLEDVRKRFLRLLSYQRLEGLCRDVLIADRSFSTEAQDRLGISLLWVNPLGAWHRDLEQFGETEAREAILTAMLRQAGPIEGAGGSAWPLVSGDELYGGAWFQLGQRPDRGFPATVFMVLGAGGMLLALGVYLYLARAMAEAEEKARRAERELVLSSRLAALGTLAAGIAHEINNPLGGMVNAVSRLKRRAGEVVDPMLGLIEEGLDRIGSIARRTLEFAPRSAAPVRFGLGRSVESARALVEHRLERRGVRLEVVDDSTRLVRGDPHELGQVFLNLFLNSLDAFDEAGTAAPVIEVGLHDLDGREPRVVARVRDNGPGVPPQVLDRIFDPFFSTKGATSSALKQSSGLGLSITYALVEQHGGRVRARNPEGGGFVVEVELPVAGPEEQRGGADDDR
ncbi:MAG: ATP-binding protein [Planctomycetota bacterium]